jgi:hypothetical protein
MSQILKEIEEETMWRPDAPHRKKSAKGLG